MSISIGEYVRQKLRGKNISNKEAGESIGISESAFEKILRQDEIYASSPYIIFNQNSLGICEGCFG